MRAGQTCFLLLALGGAVFVAQTAPRLPEHVATHFNAPGAPNGWASRSAYVGIVALFGLVLPLAVVALTMRVAAAAPQALNVPGRDYWFQPVRRAEGLRRLESHMWWFACLLLALLLALHGLLLAANRAVPPRLPLGPFLGVMTAFLIGLALWSVSLYRVMRPLPPEGSVGMQRDASR